MTTSTTWLAETIRGQVLARVTEAGRAAQEAGVRPRLVIFDYLETPVAHALRAMAQDLGMLVGVEAIERALPSANLRDRFRLLEKSKGVHGIFLPSNLTEAHRASVEAHPDVRALDIDRGPEAGGLSPQIVAFLQLAAAYGWDPENRSATVVFSALTRTTATRLAGELDRVGMTVSLLSYQSDSSSALSRSGLVWLCHGESVSLGRMHLCRDTVVVDSGRALEISASLTEAQTRLMPSRVRGFCPADRGLAALVNLNRIHRLLVRSLGTRRARALTSPSSVSRGRARA